MLKALLFCAAVVPGLLLVTGAVCAFPDSPTATVSQDAVGPTALQGKSLFEFHGAFYQRGRSDINRDNSSEDRRYSVTAGAATVSYNPSPLVSVYVRFGFQLLSPSGSVRYYNTDYYPGHTGFRGAAAFDQYGVIYHDVSHGLTIKLGRQSQPLDVSDVLYDQSYRYGLYSFLDGISVVQKIGTGTVQGYAFSEDQYHVQATRNGLLALRGTVGIGRTVGKGRTVTLGATLARFASSAGSRRAGILSTTNYESDMVLAYRATQVTLEYAKSDAAARSDLYFIGGKYKVTSSDSVSVLSYKVGQNADIGHDSEYLYGARGTRYIYEHFFSIKLEGIVYYETIRQLNNAGKIDPFYTSLLYTF